MALAPVKLNYLFVTHLHEDHTVGIPSLILNPFKLNIPAPKTIFGPEGIDEMVEHILAAWKIDIAAELSDGYDPIGAQATGISIDVEQQGVVFEDDNVDGGGLQDHSRPPGGHVCLPVYHPGQDNHVYRGRRTLP